MITLSHLSTVCLKTMDILKLYRETGAYLEGHFLLASGRHSPKFLQSTTVLQYPQHAETLGAALAQKLKSTLKTAPSFVIGPAMGGIVLAHSVAKALGCRALFAEKDGAGGMKIREAFRIEQNEPFVAVEDVVTTGGSLQKTISAAEADGGRCVGVGCIIDRGTADMDLIALETLSFPTYPADACPLCDEGVPLETV